MDVSFWHKDCYKALGNGLRGAILVGGNVNKLTRHRLTAIEREMVLSIARGCTDRDIARQFLLSTDDVKRNLAKLFGKVGVDNRFELVIHAAGNGLLDQAARIP
jgi:DNA-binding NarL/FixJ family response regulator